MNPSLKSAGGSVIGPQFVGQAGVAENPAGLAIVVLMDQDPARQHPERALDDAHVLVQHQMMDVGAVQQRPHRRNQHDIVGPNQFPQLTFLLYGPRLEGGPTPQVWPNSPPVPLPRSAAVSIVS